MNLHWYEDDQQPTVESTSAPFTAATTRTLASAHFTASQLEEAMTVMLRNLEIAIVITKRNQSYSWEVLEGGGRCASFLEAAEKALTYLQRCYLTQDKELETNAPHLHEGT